MSIFTERNPLIATKYRLVYVNQLIIGRKFSDGFSLQIMPTHVHKNLVEKAAYKNDIIAIGIAGRNRLTKSTTFNYEYYFLPANQADAALKNCFSVGFDIETGGHVFQLHFTNAQSMIEKGFITETRNDWTKGEFSFGFNISRVFTIGSR